ncbi:MAG: glucuronate isomerase, partial [Clostridia bacterium]|nr:glucuronate isomerase [Clostridia bacterium]
MKQFMDHDFLLCNDTAKTLYHDYASQLPLVDYHCHIDPREIFENRQFENITQIWLGGDHYKWRIMRSNGVPEEYITGNAPDRDKFQKFAEALTRGVGNPMYHWCHLELKTYFGYEGVLNGETAQEVWDLCNEKLKVMRARDFISQSNVAMIGTTDDPCSDLAYHALIANEGLDCKV